MRNLSLDRAKVFLSVLVVMIHVGFLKDYSESANYFFTQSIFRIVVPFFFIVSGFFFFRLLAKSNFSGFKNWALHLLLLHTIWSLVYLVFYVPFGLPLNEIALEVLKRYIEGYWHLWFTMGLLGAGVCVYVLRNLSTIQLAVVAFSLFIVGCCIQYLGNYHLVGVKNIDNIFNKTHIYRNFLFFGAPFFIFGYLIAKEQWVTKITTPQSVTLLITSFFCLCGEGLLNTKYIGDYDQSFDLLFSLPLVAGSLFLLLMKSDKKTSSALNTEISAGIYFIHPLFILLMPKILQSRLIELLVVCILSLITSFLLIWLNKKTKFLL